MANPRHLLGLHGEAAAASWLEARGWRIIERRWRGGGGELDLVCRDPDGALVAVEVKVRSSGRSGTPGESLDPRRLRRLRHGLAAYAAAARTPLGACRLDLVTLTPDGSCWRLEHQRSVDGW